MLSIAEIWELVRPKAKYDENSELQWFKLLIDAHLTGEETIDRLN